MRYRIQVPLLALALSALSGCNYVRRVSGAGGGHAEISWTGEEQTGRLGAPARARWCAREARLELVAERGDTAFAFIIRPPGIAAPAAGSYPVQRPLVPPAAPPRQSASTALRIFAASGLLGYQGNDGSVVLERVGKTISGRVVGTMVPFGSDPAAGAQGFPVIPIRIAVRFDQVPVDEACDAAHRSRRTVIPFSRWNRPTSARDLASRRPSKASSPRITPAHWSTRSGPTTTP
ncbi:MAG: hypothetical protein ACOY71_02815 [Gemmatimonadota bacterium]